ncbi:MAG: biotin/lipoate A/B protein ligase family protein [Chloroflexota bacterium]
MQFQKGTWRLLRMPANRGAWNMAVDEAILESVYTGRSMSTLRLYAWDPPCLSLGYAQSAADVNLAYLDQAAWQLVRRPTGGRAILHTDELTYTVIAPLHEPRISGSVIESYSHLAAALLQALILLGLPAEAKERYSNSKTQKKHNPVCFEVPSNYEITVRGKKLIGSAQARRKEGVLQHGSLPLYGDLTRITLALNYASPNQRQLATDRLLKRATTVESELGRSCTWKEAASAFEQAFSTVLNLKFVQGELSEEEIVHAKELLENKYDHPSWTKRI